MTRQYRYKGKEIAGYIQKDPAVVTRYLTERKDLEIDVGRVIEKIKRADINNQTDHLLLPQV